MARPKEIIDQSLVGEARKELERFRDGKIYLRLIVIVRAGEHPIVEVAKFFGLSRDTVSRWIKRFRREGVEGLRDRPKGHNPSKLSDEQKEEIAKWVETGKDAHQKVIHWTLTRLQQEVASVWGVRVSVFPLWDLLHKLGFRQKVPRQVHAKADPKAQETLKKRLRKLIRFSLRLTAWCFSSTKAVSDCSRTSGGIGREGEQGRMQESTPLTQTSTSTPVFRRIAASRSI